MNKTERAYSEHLENKLKAGLILGWQFEAITLVLSHGGNGKRGIRYTPDFAVYTATGIEFHEVKGFMREDAKLKLRWAVDSFPVFSFRVVKRSGRDWLFHSIPPNKEAQETLNG